MLIVMPMLATAATMEKARIMAVAVVIPFGIIWAIMKSPSDTISLSSSGFPRLKREAEVIPSSFFRSEANIVPWSLTHSYSPLNMFLVILTVIMAIQ